MRSLVELGSANLRHRKGRTVLTALGVVFGVAMFLGTQEAGATLNRAVRQQFGQVNGRIDISAIPEGTVGGVLDAGTVSKLAGLPGVERATSQLDVPATRSDGSSLTLVGIDQDAPSLINYPVAAGRLPAAGAAEVMITARNDARLGDRLTLATTTGEHGVAVVGLLRNKGVGKARQGSVVFTSLANAQSLAGQGQVVDEVRLTLVKGTSKTSWLHTHRHDVVGVQLSDARTGSLGLGIVGTGLTFFSVLAFFVGAYLIYLTLSEAVVERTAIYGLLRALGATRRQVRRVVTHEAAALGVVATLVGLVFGELVALALIQVFASIDGISSPGFVFSLPPVAISAVLGIVCSLLGARRPARRASRISPVVAMRGDVEARTRLSRGWVVGVVLLTLSVLDIATTTSIGPLLLGTVALLAGAVLVMPPLLGPLALLVGRGTGKLSPGVARITLLHLREDRSRSAYTLALLMSVMAVVVGAALAITAAFTTVDQDLTKQLIADLQVTSPEPIPSPTLAQIQHTPGVAEVSPEGYGTTAYIDRSGDHPLSLFVIDPTTYFDLDGFAWAKGSSATAHAALKRGGAVLLPVGLANQRGLGVGHTVVLRTAIGPKEFRVAANFAGQDGYAQAVVVGLPDAQTMFGGGRPDELLIKVAAGQNKAAIADRLRSELHAGSSYRFDDTHFNVVSAEQVHSDIRSHNHALVAIFNVIEVVGLAVGLMGLANMLAMSVLLRFREIGLLRAVGAQRRQLVGMVIVEASTLAAIALVIAIPVGAGVGVAFLGLVRVFTDTAHFSLTMRILIELLLIATVVAVLAAWLPARRAARLTPVETLRFD